MRLEELQDAMEGGGTLRHGYAVVWNGTTESASGSRYLDAEHYAPPVETAPPAVKRERPLTTLILDWLETHGPATIRDVANGLEVHKFKANSAMAALRARNAVVIVGHRVMEVEDFGARNVAVWGLAS